MLSRRLTLTLLFIGQSACGTDQGPGAGRNRVDAAGYDGGTETAPVILVTADLEGVVGPVGGQCASDTNCETGLTCLLDSPLLGGTIALGLCTKACSRDANLCAALVPSAVCYGDDAEAYCMQACTPGGDGLRCSTEDAAGNQLARLNQMCLPLGAVTGEDGAVCVPKCFDDLECPDGLRCSQQTGTCSDAARGSKGYGAPCRQDDECVGELCLPGASVNTDAPGYCSAYCALSPFAGCGADPRSTQPPRFVCFPFIADANPPDMGLCTPLCNETADCPSELTCSPFADEELTGDLGFDGICGPD